MMRSIKLTSSIRPNSSIWKIVFYLTVLHSLLSLKLNAQSTSVTFSVDLTFVSLSSGESIVLRGNSATLGRWQGSDLRLAPAGDNLYTITVTFPEHELNQEFFYKFVIVGPQQLEQWETRTNRSLYLTSGPHILESVFFDDLDRPVLTNDLHVRISLDLDHLESEPPTRVGLTGNRFPLRSTAPDMLTILNQETGLWTADLLFEAGTPTDLSFTFFLEIDGRWMQEPRRHTVLLNNNRPVRTITMVHDGARIMPAFHQNDMHTDNFAGIASTLGNQGSRYLLDAALQQLDAGLFDEALNTYQKFKTDYLDSASSLERILLQDKFPIHFGQTLYATGQTFRAITFFDLLIQETASPAHKGTFAYALAASQLASGDYYDAIQSFDELENNYANSTENAHSFLRERGIAYLESGQYRAGVQILNNLEINEHLYVEAVKILGNAHADSINFDAAIDTFELIKTLGTEEEQMKMYLLILETKIKAGYYAEALQQIESLLNIPSPTDSLEDHLYRSAKNPFRTAHLLFLKARIFEIQQQASAADVLYRQVISKFPDTKHARLAFTRTSHKTNS